VVSQPIASVTVYEPCHLKDINYRTHSKPYETKHLGLKGDPIPWGDSISQHV